MPESLFFAHSSPGQALEEAGEPLREHLTLVAGTAARFAEPLGAALEARAAGLLHDLGKYSELFLRRLRGMEKGLDHWSNGAWAALTHYREAGIITALAIEGHHIGLQSGADEALRALEPKKLLARHPRGLTLTEADTRLLLARFAADGLELPHLADSLTSRIGPLLPWMLDVRLLFSCLVDADYLETEAHFQRAAQGERRYRPEGPALAAGEALARLELRVRELAASAPATGAVVALRNEVYADCHAAATAAPGLFTLTAPTGSGKTLAMLAFALRHAVTHGLRRVIVALPYLNIAEQTARVYRELFTAAFGENYVIENHSLADGATPPDGGEAGAASLARLLAENWDAPLVLTTNVQLLESLFANRPAACRKLHRLAGSVILFDEAQALPPKLAVPTLAALSHLAARYRSSVVFATATQPAFDHLDGEVKKHGAEGWRPREILRRPTELFAAARRNRVRWETAEPRTWAGLAEEIAEREQVLVIVNLKRHARDLAAAVEERVGRGGLFHLSTNLCPSHREAVLQEVRARLAPDSGAPCRLIATQCVEAGVDLDFPSVWRALGPLEAIAQAAGRANRNGRLAGGGEVRVFLPAEEGYPPGGYEQAKDVTRSLLTEKGPAGLDLDAPELYREYFQRLYGLTKVTERWEELESAIKGQNFVEVAKHYRLINKEAIEILVPYDPAVFRVLRRELEERGRLTRDWMRKARRHSVSVFRPKHDDGLWQVLEGAPLGRDERSEEWYVLLQEELYDRDLRGLVAAEPSWIG